MEGFIGSWMIPQQSFIIQLNDHVPWRHAFIHDQFHGTDHDQISSWSLECRHGLFNDLSILRCKSEKMLIELSKKTSKTYKALFKYISTFMDSYNVKVCHKTDASRIVHG